MAAAESDEELADFDDDGGVQRQKIQIKPITSSRKRQVTFMKRKKGLMKKAQELSILCDAEVSVILFNPAGQIFEFSSANMEESLKRFESVLNDPNSEVPRDAKTNLDYKKLAKLDDEEAEELNLDANAIAMCSESPPLPTAEGSAGALLRITGAESVGTHSGSSAAGAAGNGKGLGQAWMSPRGKPGKLPPELHATMSDQLTEWCTANPGQSIPSRSMKERLGQAIGVPVRSIEYWFWARNKKIRAGISPTLLSSPRQAPVIQTWEKIEEKRRDSGKGARIVDAERIRPLAARDGDPGDNSSDDGSRTPLSPMGQHKTSKMSIGLLPEIKYERSTASPAQLQDVLGGGGFENRIDSMLDTPFSMNSSALDTQEPSYLYHSNSPLQSSSGCTRSEPSKRPRIDEHTQAAAIPDLTVMDSEDGMDSSSSDII